MSKLENQTKNYKFNRAIRGSDFNSLKDEMRFVTLDNNLTSYVGIIGSGVISGWNIASSGTTITILPGKGIINGYAVESPYFYIQRSQMEKGDWEIEEIHETDTQYPNLTPLEKEKYEEVVREYDPSHVFPDDIENCFVKVVTPSETEMVLQNNTELYIYASVSSATKPYPIAYDFPISTLKEPESTSYLYYQDYIDALISYNAEVKTFTDYRWRANLENHFSAVSFTSSNTLTGSKTKILIAKVVTRNGSVEKVDTSEVSYLQGLLAPIKKVAERLLPNHQHGGNNYFDPTKIKLESDIRSAAIYYYSPSTKTAVFKILSSTKTTIEDGHKHDFYLNSENNGFTVNQTGTEYPHYHLINELIISDAIYTNINGKQHTHNLPSQNSTNGWTSDSAFAVYINDVFFADQTSSSVSVDPDNNLLKIYGAIGTKYRQYSSEFKVNDGTIYSFTSKASSVFQFMLAMIIDFELKHTVSDIDATIVSNEGYISPFMFSGDTSGSFYGLGDLKDQSAIAQSILKNAGDSFTFTPRAARDIKVYLISEEVSGIEDYNVKIEILQNTEVFGKLKPENITYVSAEKIQLGEFAPERIPFVSHVGRMQEQLIPARYSLISSDGVLYYVPPSITKQNLNHYHKLFLDLKNSGITSQTVIGLDPVYYAEDNNGNVILVEHTHGITKGNVSSVTTDGLVEWQNNVYGNNITEAFHNHNIIYPNNSDKKIIYSIREMKDGNLFIGTSAGFMSIPITEAYLFVINGEKIYLIGNDLWDLLQKAGIIYEQLTGNPIIITSSIYSEQIAKAETMLNYHGDSILMYGNNDPSRGQDTIMVKYCTYFNVPNFKTLSKKGFNEINKDERIVSTIYVDDAGNEITQEEAEANSELTKNPVSRMAIVERDLNNIPIWQLESYTSVVNGEELEKIIVIGSDIFSKNENIQNNFYKEWINPSIPDYAGCLKKTMKDYNNNIWIVTNMGLIISRYYSEGLSLETVNSPCFYPIVYDITINGIANVIAACEDGIYLTENSGLTWQKIFTSDNKIIQLVRDMGADKTNTANNHYHLLDVNLDGNGLLGISIGDVLPHTHNVNSWIIAETLSHTHYIISTIYAVDSNGKISVSTDNGLTWEYLINSITNNNGIFAHNGLFLAIKNELYKLNGNSWEVVFNKTATCFVQKYDLSGFFVGSLNEIYETTNGVDFNLVISMRGNSNPTLINNEKIESFGYAFSGNENTFRFKEITYSKNPVSAMINFGKWFAENGIWNKNSKYDILINNKIILSTKNDIDRRIECGYRFVVSPEEGNIDFGAETLANKDVKIYDNYVSVVDSSRFYVGDRICIARDNTLIPDPPVKGELDEEGYNIILTKYYKNIAKYKKMFFYADIELIQGNTIYITERFDIDMEMPLKISKLPVVDADTSVSINIYESPLGNIGTFSHDELENELSYRSDGRAYEFNNVHLSNLLQLTQAVKYALPDIDAGHKNSKFYDFHYSWNKEDILPYIGDIVDLNSCETHNFNLFTNSFYNMGAKKINKILFGIGKFYGYIFVGTDIGLFWGKNHGSMEGNWFYVSDIKTSIYDIKVFGDFLMICSAYGTYSTKDMKTFDLLKDAAIYFPSTIAEYRWNGEETVFIPSHEAVIQNDLSSNSGSITTTSAIYDNLIDNRKINVESLDCPSINGVYSISRLANNSSLITSEMFPISEAINATITIKMGTWWDYLDGENSSDNSAISNVLLIGGTNAIAFCDNSRHQTWSESKLPTELKNFNVASFCSLSNGGMISSVIGTGSLAPQNNILYCKNQGISWGNYFTFKNVSGKIDSVNLTSDYHSKIKIIGVEKRIYVDGDLSNRKIFITNNGNVLEGIVIWNEFLENSDFLYVFGKDANDFIKSASDISKITILISPLKTNSLMESSDGSVLLSTDCGLFTDNKSIIGNRNMVGQVLEVGISGIISSIDIAGQIVSVSKTIDGNTIFSIRPDRNIFENEIANKVLFITDLAEVISFNVIRNSGMSISGEILVEIASYYQEFDSYYGKKIIFGQKDYSRVYFSTNQVVLDGEFDGGKIIISSNEKNNFGKSYNVIKSFPEYADVSPAIIPSSTTADGVTNNDLACGQSIKFINKEETIKLIVKYFVPIKENQLAGMNLSVNGSYGAKIDSSLITVYSNDFNSITLNKIEPPNGNMPSILYFGSGDSCFPYGFSISPLMGFNNKLSSVESDHYHDISLLNKRLVGTVMSFSNVESSFVDVNVSSDNGFDDIFVQQNGDLLENAKIVFYNEKDNNAYWYDTKIVNHTANTIKVNLKSSSMWNFSSYDKNHISETWKWEIWSENYGYSMNTYYKDFSVLSTEIIKDVRIGAYQIYVNSSTGIYSGDKIEIFSSTGKSEYCEIQSIIDINTLSIVSGTKQSYNIKDGLFVKVLRDNFANNHVHKIRNKQVETLYIYEYLQLGYSSLHSHIVSPLITNVAKTKQRISDREEIIAIGNSKNVFSSYNNGDDWSSLVDLTSIMESNDPNEEIKTITDIVMNQNNKLVVGTGSGYIAAEADIITSVPLEKPNI